MIEQWFLDLDGTRSGPYHTPEIMSLIAEGEVLPHHRISISLKDQPWVTVLDWRLDQAKIIQSGPNIRPYRSEVSAVDGMINTPGVPEVPTKAVEMAKEPEPEPEPAPTPLSSANSDIETFLQEKSKIDETLVSDFHEEPVFENYPTEIPADLHEEVTREIPASASSRPPGPPQISPNKEERPARRDPMAEMFDVLQKSKQKRESKQMPPLQVGMSIEADAIEAKKPSQLPRTLGICAGIVVIGFALGQLFQTTTPPAANLTLVPSPTPRANAMSSATPAAAQLVDRSTDKMLIRANVERKTIELSTPTPRPFAGKPASADALQNEKELEELKNLKKELQELKALKNSAPEELSEPEMDETGVVDPGEGYDVNGFPISGPGGTSAVNPQGIPQSGEPPPVR